jgi:hypothetical protein
MMPSPISSRWSSTMVDGKARMADSPDRPDQDDANGAPRLHNSAAWLAELVALEDEFKEILSRNALPVD